MGVVTPGTKLRYKLYELLQIQQQGCQPASHQWRALDEKGEIEAVKSQNPRPTRARYKNAKLGEPAQPKDDRTARCLAAHREPLVVAAGSYTHFHSWLANF